jgi:hypothetical protein
VQANNGPALARRFFFTASGGEAGASSPRCRRADEQERHRRSNGGSFSATFTVKGPAVFVDRWRATAAASVRAPRRWW